MWKNVIEVAHSGSCHCLKETKRGRKRWRTSTERIVVRIKVMYEVYLYMLSYIRLLIGIIENKYIKFYIERKSRLIILLDNAIQG